MANSLVFFQFKKVIFGQKKGDTSVSNHPFAHLIGYETEIYYTLSLINQYGQLRLF